jgi:hypothetical protein
MEQREAESRWIGQEIPAFLESESLLMCSKRRPSGLLPEPHHHTRRDIHPLCRHSERTQDGRCCVPAHFSKNFLSHEFIKLFQHLLSLKPIRKIKYIRYTITLSAEIIGSLLVELQVYYKIIRSIIHHQDGRLPSTALCSLTEVDRVSELRAVSYHHDDRPGSLHSTISQKTVISTENKFIKYIKSIYILLLLLLFSGAYSPGRTFGLPFRGFLITHTDTR